MDHNSVCYCDHFPITFNVSGKVKCKRIPKREFYNFKKANWSGLNADLQAINWDFEFSSNNINVCWIRFKEIFFRLVDKHIPKVKVKNEFQSPWFDSDCYEASRNKEKPRKKLKNLNYSETV